MTSRLTMPNRFLAGRLSPTTVQAGLLFSVDMVTNGVDYLFHFFLAWALSPADFVTVQTINALLLVAVTAFGVLQPVVARFVAGDVPADEDTDATKHGPAAPTASAAQRPAPAAGNLAAARQRGIFQLYFRQGALLGVAAFTLIWLARTALADWLNLPRIVLSVAATTLFFIVLRPVVAGMLQGQQRFVPFGLTRTAYAVSRLGLALLFIGWLGGGALAAVALFPVATFLSLGVGLLFLGQRVWATGPKPSRAQVWIGWRLSLAALLAYGSYMLLLNLDLVWVNRQFTAVPAATYATLVVLRRILALLPGVVLVILYPRIVRRVAAGDLPDRLLAKSAVIIGGVGALVSAGFFLLAPLIVGLASGGNYPAAAPLLGWMGLAMTGYGLVAIWLNLYLATKPWPFVVVLVVALLGQLAAMTRWHASLAQMTAVFGLTGWLLVIAGLLCYLFWLRPFLARRPAAPGPAGQAVGH